MSVWAAPIQSYVSAAATQLGEREAYARAMLGPLGSRTSTTRGAASSKVSPPAGVRREVTR
jgi:hypothetical protein